MANSITGESYTNENIQELQNKLDKANQSLQQFNTTAATDESLRQQATNEYTPIYNAQVQQQEALKNSAASALKNQLSALDRQYARDQETLGRNYDNQRVTANNTMLARGFNNSSLAAAMLNHVETERGRALQNLAEARAAGEASAHDTYNNAISAADAALARLASDLQMNIDSRYQALKDKDYDRVFQAQQAQNAVTQYVNELMLQIEQLRQQGYSQYLQQQQDAWEREMYEKEHSGSGSGGSSGNNNNPSPQPEAEKPGLDDEFNRDKPVASGAIAKAAYDMSGVDKLISNTVGKAKSTIDSLKSTLKSKTQSKTNQKTGKQTVGKKTTLKKT